MSDPPWQHQRRRPRCHEHAPLYFHSGILAFVFGHVWQRPALDVRDRRLVTLPCVGLSDVLGPIRSHIGSALQSRDISYNEMPDHPFIFSAYYGFAKGEVMNDVAVEECARIEAQEAAAK